MRTCLICNAETLKVFGQKLGHVVRLHWCALLEILRLAELKQERKNTIAQCKWNRVTRIFDLRSINEKKALKKSYSKEHAKSQFHIQ
jgi:hypothetical protein